MALPTPAPGLLISYAHLWSDAQRAGLVEGRKERPCLILAVTTDGESDTLAYVAPVTHSASDDSLAVEIPLRVKRRLGLDAERSWISTRELNRFVWPGYDLRPISRDRPDRFEWGYVPVEVFQAAKRAYAEQHRLGRLRIVARD